MSCMMTIYLVKAYPTDKYKYKIEMEQIADDIWERELIQGFRFNFKANWKVTDGDKCIMETYGAELKEYLKGKVEFDREILDNDELRIEIM